MANVDYLIQPSPQAIFRGFLGPGNLSCSSGAYNDLGIFAAPGMDTMRLFRNSMDGNYDMRLHRGINVLRIWLRLQWSAAFTGGIVAVYPVINTIRDLTQPIIYARPNGVGVYNVGTGIVTDLDVYTTSESTPFNLSVLQTSGSARTLTNCWAVIEPMKG